VTSTFHRRVWVLLFSAGAAYGCWKYIPGTPIDRCAFHTVVSSFTNGPLFITGHGSHTEPWALNAITSGHKPDTVEGPIIISLGDDPKNFFQSSPPAPIDLAVIFLNLQRLGVKKIATAAVLAWESPDPIALTALEKTLDSFDSVVMAAPLSRGAIPSIMPAAFRRASLPVTSVIGNASVLPIVNHIPLSGIILGGENTLAGFSLLEPEVAGNKAPLIACWEDRVVLAFPLLTALQRYQIPIDAVEIRLGEYIRLGPNGPIIPIDDYGRLAVSLNPIEALNKISAQALIDRSTNLFPKTSPSLVILRDDQSAAEPSTRDYSKKLVVMVAALASDHEFSTATVYSRLPTYWEISALSVFALILTLFCSLKHFARMVAFVLLAELALSTQWVAAEIASIWLPGLPMLAAILAAYGVARIVIRNPDTIPHESENSMEELESLSENASTTDH
jgi:hypothetical protein